MLAKEAARRLSSECHSSLWRRLGGSAIGGAPGKVGQMNLRSISLEFSESAEIAATLHCHF
jgi:hypothetical protein